MTAIVDPPGFGQYELLAKIGEGPRGPVFVARTPGEASADTLHVLEVCAFSTDEDEAVRTFVRDVERAAGIRDRNVISIVEIGANAAGHYVVMEYIEGCTFSEIQERHRAIRPPRLVLATVIDALQGLHAAHSLCGDDGPRPLAHGSLSPDHMLIGLDGACRVSGFGNARPRVQTRPSHRSRSTTGYMAPEQLNGGEVDQRADLFSVGVVLWNALTGKKLFHDRIEHMTMSNVLERKVPRPSTIGLSPPPAFDAVVLKALERDPVRRFQTAADMARALHDVARAASCLAGGAEVGEWITTTFGTELAARRRTIREIAARVALPLAAPPQEISELPRLGVTAPPESTARDELSLDELARAADPPVRSAIPALSPITGAPHAYPQVPARRQLAIIAVAAFAVVACVLGWRWALVVATTEDGPALESAASLSGARPAAPSPSPPSQVELEVTVLEVRTVTATATKTTATTTGPATETTPAPAKPWTPPPPGAPSPDKALAPPAVAAPPVAPAVTSSPARAPVRAVKRPPQRPAPPQRPSEVRADPPEPKPPEPRPEPPPPPKAETPPRPTLESNPYLYK
jgi:hypothetical protein